MTTAIEIYQSEEFGQIRTVMVENQPWFVGRDVASALQYKDSTNALKSHVDADDKMGWRITTPSRGVQRMTIINESGLYALIFGSKLESAKRFKRWVTAEVLPAIRKTGAYSRERKTSEFSVSERQETCDWIEQSMREAAEKAYWRNIGRCHGIVNGMLEKERGEMGSIMAVYGLLSDDGKALAMKLIQGEGQP